ncbi:MAG: ATP-binding protein [Bacteroidia bacterium]|nr:ATP-binding protein [Bacteroidia bacterium]
MNIIENITIEGLFGEHTLNIPIKDNKLLLVAENGSGKTTIVNIIYFFLSKQWIKLLRYNFSKITATIDGEKISLNKEDIDLFRSDKIQKFLMRYPSNLREKLFDFFLTADPIELFRTPQKMELAADKLNIPMSIFFELSTRINREQFNLFSNISEKNLQTNKIIDAQILYLPTYRRIEQDLKNIFPDLESDIDKYRRRKRINKTSDETSYVELVEFGMEYVEVKINNRLNELKENLNNKLKNDLTGTYLKDVINKRYTKISTTETDTFDEKVLSSILNIIDEDVLSKAEKEKLITFVGEIKQVRGLKKDENKMIAFFIYRLINIYNEQKKEEQDIVEFVNICNQYSSNKEFIYDNINFQLYISPKVHGEIRHKERIELKDLSSGEKQIVSLFSHLYLSKQRYFVIIDEPELSLSVPWQQRFLSDVNSNQYCDGIIAVTHSPFIFENELEEYSHTLSEFIS